MRPIMPRLRRGSRTNQRTPCGGDRGPHGSGDLAGSAPASQASVSRQPTRQSPTIDEIATSASTGLARRREDRDVSPRRRTRRCHPDDELTVGDRLAKDLAVAGAAFEQLTQKRVLEPPTVASSVLGRSPPIMRGERAIAHSVSMVSCSARVSRLSRARRARLEGRSARGGACRHPPTGRSAAAAPIAPAARTAPRRRTRGPRRHPRSATARCWHADAEGAASRGGCPATARGSSRARSP